MSELIISHQHVSKICIVDEGIISIGNEFIYLTFALSMDEAMLVSDNLRDFATHVSTPIRLSQICYPQGEEVIVP